MDAFEAEIRHVAGDVVTARIDVVAAGAGLHLAEQRDASGRVVAYAFGETPDAAALRVASGLRPTVRGERTATVSLRRRMAARE